MSIHISCDMYPRLGLHVQIRLYYVLSYRAKISAQYGIGFIFDRCIVYFGLTMPNLLKKRQLIFKIFNIKKCTPSIYMKYESSLPLLLKAVANIKVSAEKQTDSRTNGQAKNYMPPIYRFVCINICYLQL